MVNTMASYLLSAGMGTSYGISTGKDLLILFPIKNILELAQQDEPTKLIVAYIEPGGLYETEAVEMLGQIENPKPIIAYITGNVLGEGELALGHAGAVVEGKGTSAEAKMELFDEYFGTEPFDRDTRYKKSPALAEKLKRGIRITTLHHLPAAAALLCGTLGIDRDFKPSKPLKPNPWFVDYKYNGLAKQLPRRLILHRGTIPKPYATQVKLLTRETIGANPPRRSMRKASHASANDGRQTRIYGEPLQKEMQKGSLVESLLFYWLGRRPRDFEAKAVEKCLIGALTNGPGTISAQGAKLSTSAGNAPHTAMIATLACIGDVHGGNGRRAVEYLCRIFGSIDIEDPFKADHGLDIKAMAEAEATRFSKVRAGAKEAGTDYDRIPCLGHPVFKDKPVNYDPREQTIAEYLEKEGLCNVFLQFYHLLALRLKEIGIARNVWAVNLDGAIASVVLGLCWKPLKEKQMTLQRVCDIAFMVFALGRVAGAGGEFLDHQDYGTAMDMRIPVDEITVLGR